MFIMDSNFRKSRLIKVRVWISFPKTNSLIKLNATELPTNWATISRSDYGMNGPPIQKDLMTDLALTSPVFPPADEQDVLNGRGIAFPGGSAGSVYPGIMSEWKCLHIPSTSLLLEPDGKGGDIGLGNRAEEHIKDKSLAGFYCGRKRALYEGAMDTPPSRYGVSVRSAQQREKFSIDGFMGPKLTIQWLKTHQVTCPFMNAGN